MSGPKFYTQDGWLTSYGLACGYQELHQEGSITTRMYLEGCLHVRQHDHGSKTRLAWDTFPRTELAAARKRYRELVANATVTV